MTTTARPTLARLRVLLALLMLGQGALVVTGILDHEAPLATGLALVAGGALLLLLGPRRAPAAAPAPATLRGRGALVAALGVLAAGGVVAYNAYARNGWALPELAILAYGIALIAAAPRLDERVRGVAVGTLVAYSFPLVLAPLGLYAINAAITTGAGATPLSFYIRHGLVTPMAAALAVTGIDVGVIGDTVRLSTPRGSLFLTVGVVCAGLYAMAVFLGIFALFAWEHRTTGWRLAAYLGVGLVGLHLANVLRLVVLALVGHRWGGEMLQAFHRHAGWVLFLAWTLLFWWVVLRRLEAPRAATAPTLEP